jgi:uncharacterized protein (TIGR02145 family)
MAMKSTLIYVSIFAFSLSLRCKPEEIILHGNLTGNVTDAESGVPVEGASAKLSSTNEFTSTDSEGFFIFKNLAPKEYEIQVSKSGYVPGEQNVQVNSAETKEVNFSLIGAPVPRFSSTCLDLGLDSASLTFEISNHGKGSFSYIITKAQDWITFSPSTGEVANETDLIRVAVNKAGLSESIYNETIVVTSTGPGVLIKDTLHLNLNGVADLECNYYKVVRIGTQTWMAENLNIGSVIEIHQEQEDNGHIEKWCYDCNIYGGLYNWYEAMNYSPSDTGDVGITQGICPVGWHIPTPEEVDVLSDYLSGPLESPGGKLKAVSPLWQDPNVGATNETGFTALPGGRVVLAQFEGGYFDEDPFSKKFDAIGMRASFWTSGFYPDHIFFPPDPHPINIGNSFFLYYQSDVLQLDVIEPAKTGNSVRCIKNP